MKPKKGRRGPVQSSLIRMLLKDTISDDHHLVKLADLVEWEKSAPRLRVQPQEAAPGHRPIFCTYSLSAS